MRPLALSLLLAVTVAQTAMAHAATPAGGDDRCWADWSTASPIVHREALAPAKDLLALAQVKGQVLTITLCEQKGRYVYRLRILRAAGTVETVTVDARDPFGR